MINQKKYVVTGGAGFIGSHLIELLIHQGFDVVCIDDLSTGSLSNLPENNKIVFINSKVQDVLLSAIGEISGIFHLAAQASVPVSIDDFYNSSSNNLLSTLRVFEWAKELNVPVVYASSSAVYGNLPKGDDTVDKFNILSPYAQDKLTMEHYAKMAWDVYKTKSIGLRFFNVYGPRQDPSNPYSGVISIFVDRLLNKDPVTVNGGYQTRDFIYVKDIVNTISKSMQELNNSDLCETLNVGTGYSISIDKLLETLCDILVVNPKVIKAELPKGDPEKSSGTYEKLELTLGVELSKFTGLNEGLNETINSLKN